MKRIFLLSLVTILTILGANAQKRQVQAYGVAFYNLENLFDTINNNGKYDEEFSPNGGRQWNSEKYWSKIHNMAYTITNFTTKATPNGPAFIGVSEIENRTVLEDLVKEIDKILIEDGRTPWGLQIRHHDSPDRRGVDVGCLYNPRMFKFLNETNHRLVIPRYEEEHGYPFRSRDQMCVTGVMGGDTVSIIVNHWPSRLGGEEQSSYLREAAGSLCKEIADSIWRIRPNEGVIIMGDLNDDPQNKSCAVAVGAQREDKNVGPHDFYNPFWKILDKGIGTLAYKGQWNLFDQIMVSGTLLKKNGAELYFKNAIVNNFDFLKDNEGQRQNYPKRTYSGGVFLNGYSDHYPTEIILVRERK